MSYNSQSNKEQFVEFTEVYGDDENCDLCGEPFDKHCMDLNFELMHKKEQVNLLLCKPLMPQLAQSIQPVTFSTIHQRQLRQAQETSSIEVTSTIQQNGFLQRKNRLDQSSPDMSPKKTIEPIAVTRKSIQARILTYKDMTFNLEYFNNPKLCQICFVKQGINGSCLSCTNRLASQNWTETNGYIESKPTNCKQCLLNNHRSPSKPKTSTSSK